MRLHLSSLIAAALAVTTLALAAPANASQISAGRAVEVAEQQLKAKAFEVELEFRGAVAVYDVELVRNGERLKADVDVQTGAVTERSGRWRIEREDRERMKAVQTSHRSLGQIIAAVERQTHGAVKDVGLDRSRGRTYYEMELAGAGDREVRVDVLTGAISPVLQD
ncbi:hypothetical protein BH10PSE4_BH10PSE4_16730 [soil metagenome]